MGIEFVEEASTSCASGEFLPPVITAIRCSGRSAFSIVISVAFLLVATALCACGLSVGLPLFLIATFLLVAEIIGFIKSKGVTGGYGLGFRRNAYIFTAVLCFGFAVFIESREPYYWYCDMLEPLFDFAKDLPKPFCNIMKVGFLGEFIVCAALGVALFTVGLSYGSLKRSKAKNLPFSKTLLFSVFANILASALLVCDGLERLYILPSTYKYNDWDEALKLSRYCDVGIDFLLAAVVLLWTIRLLITFIRMRKVKNAVLKA